MWYMIIFKLAWKLLEDRKLLVNFKVNTNLKFKFLYNLWFENFKNYINVLIKKKNYKKAIFFNGT